MRSSAQQSFPGFSSRPAIYLVGLVIGSVLVAAADSFAYLRDIELTSAPASFWRFVFNAVLSLWVVEDSKAHPAVYRPFQFGFLVYTFSLVYVPYYLWRTRGAAGLLMIPLFLALYFLGYLAQLALYAAS